MKDCTTCKYGYEDERLGIQMCHHPKRFSENCVDFNMHEEKHPDGKSDKSLEEAAKEYEWSNVDTNQLNPPTLDITVQVGDLRNAFIAGAEWQKQQMLKDAVEGKIYLGNDYCTYELIASLVGLPRGTYKDGDKVRIVVLKEEK